MLNELISSAFSRHHRIGFQFSGHRDSTAALFLLRPLWSRMTVYHLDTLDQFPETRRVVAAVERLVPITRIYSDAYAVRLQHGLPSDVVPIDHHDVGRNLSGEGFAIQGRLECCARTLMMPMHQRMLDDKITLIVRGVRRDEFNGAMVTRSGDTDGRVELLFPIEDWTAADVDRYIADRGLPVADWYAGGSSEGYECMGCTAWWGDGRLQYLAKKYPEKAADVYQRIHVIRAAIDRQLNTLPKE